MGFACFTLDLLSGCSGEVSVLKPMISRDG